ncbi:hypothetical protein E0Z10_g2025 [Xylaria hypoxylon]|uniref:Uncharacterized protein n=1 Tax=Xylaria hypoxylon TaxID=37992 RepID=A0A4Z0YQT5_9PEZI|nr:hypothetical protein E0Z10_g2025 [Xylaria hypoxylon]
MTCMLFSNFTTRLQRLVGLKSKAAAAAAAAAAAGEKRNSHTLQISAPFNFKHETISLPGLSEDDIAILKEKAAASRLGVAGANKDGSSTFGSPRKAPRAPPSPLQVAVAPVVVVAPDTPLSAEHNVI